MFATPVAVLQSAEYESGLFDQFEVELVGVQISQMSLPLTVPDEYSVPLMSQSVAQDPTVPVQISPLPQLVPAATAWNALVDVLGVQTSHAPAPDDAASCPEA